MRQGSLATDWGPVGSLTALQLATYLGDHRMFVHIMKRRKSINWVWGPVTEYRLHLEGIDSYVATPHTVHALSSTLH